MGKKPPIFAACLCVLFFLAMPGGASAESSIGRDFHLGHTGWNGLSRLADLTRDLGCSVEVRRRLDWSKLDGQDVLFVLHPETPLDPERVLSYLSAGGRLILADDYGSAGPLYERLGISREVGPLPAGTPLYRKNPGLPVATPQRNTALGRSASELVANHPAYFHSALPATFAFAPGAGLLIEGTLGRGRFVAIADSSLFINNMLDLAGNRALLQRMLLDLCRAQRDRLLILYGPIEEHGAPPQVLPGAPSEGLGGDVADRVNRAMGGANMHVLQTLRRGKGGGLDVVALCGLLFCLAALALLLRYLPMPVPPQDETFAQPPRPPETGLFASVLRYAGGAGEVSWGYVYPATLLREEVQARLQPLLVELPKGRGATGEGPSPQEVRAHLEKRISPRAGELAATLLEEVRRLDRGPQKGNHPSGAHIRERTLQRWYELAMELFAELAEKREHRPKDAHRDDYRDDK
jgi:hypothetical protein